MNKALVFSAIALPVAAFGALSQPSIATAQNAGFANWSGPSATVLGGGVWGSSSQLDNMGASGSTGPTGPTGSTGLTGPTGADGRYHMSGALFGGGFGYNWQNGPWVAGISGDLSGGSVKGSSRSCGGVADTCGTKLNELGTVRGLFGYANGQYLLFATVGPAWGHIRAFDTLFDVSGGKVQTGVAFGGGLDIMLSRQMSFKIEYLHIDFGKTNLFDIVPGTPEQVSTKADVIRAGLTFYPR